MTEFETPSDTRPRSTPIRRLKPGQDQPVTGDPDVDEVIVTLEGLEDLPVAEHPAVYSRAHDALRDALAGKADRAEES